MATAVVEIGAEGAEAVAPELEEAGAKIAPKFEEVGSKAASKVEGLFGKKAAEETAEVGTEEAAKAAEAPAGRQTMDRLMDVGTGVMIGQSLQGSDTGSKAAQGATQTLAAVGAPPGAMLAAAPAATGGASRRRPRDSSGRFVRGGAGDDGTEDDDFEVFDAVATGGAAAQPGPTTIVHKAPRPLAESMQIGILVLLVIIIIAAVITIAVKKPSSLSSFGYGALLGAVSGATVYWVLGSRSSRAKHA